jgi:uncharacterized protein
MPLYVMMGIDRAGAAELRKATRPAHLEWLQGFGPAVKLAGPLLSDDGGAPVGSIIVIELDSLDHARIWAAEDPYTIAGLWERQDIRPFTRVLP